MKLSFVIPAHNEENYLPRCLDSIQKEILGKGYDVEVIVVNNASTDKTGAVARQYSFVHVVDEPISGLSRARQAGFEASHGDLIANVDADTMVPSGWIDTVMQAFTNNPKLVGLSGPQIFYDVPKSTQVLVKLYYYLDVVFHYINRNILRMSAVIQGGNFVVRRSALEAIGGYDVSFEFYGEDADLSRRLPEEGEVEFTLKLPIYASGRRIMVEGKIKTAGRYLINYIWTVLFGRPFTKTFSNVRSVPSRERKDA